MKKSEGKKSKCWQWLWFHNHKYTIPDKLKNTYGVFGGMKILRCENCDKWILNESMYKRLKRNGLV